LPLSVAWLKFDRSNIMIRPLIHRLRSALSHIWRAPTPTPTELTPVGPQPLYTFFDEAGDLNFGKNGSRYFLCGMLVTHNPWPIMQVLTDLREEIFRGKFIPRAFHAAEDRQVVRDRVFESICGVGGFEAYITVTEKALVPPTHTDPSTFYTFMADFTLRWVLLRYSVEEPVFVFTDELPLKGRREALVKGFKATMASILPDRAYNIEHQSSGAQGCLQAIDYVNWAVFRRLELGDDRSYVLVKDYIAYEGGLDWSLVKES